jgi:O-antigen ligase
MAFWLADGFLRKNPFAPVFLFSLFVFGALIIATGSRTPLLALTACSVWLMVVHWNRRSLVLLITIALALGTFLVFYPEGLFSRGTSLRPEIWKTVWPQILEAPWFGHGYNALWQIQMASGDIFFDNPHNLLLGVFYNLGVVGLTLWLSLYIVALTFSWRNRKNPLVIIASTLLVFGFAAGMTEGGAFLSRPKEHWFLIWIPMTLLFASELACKKEHVHTP